VTVQDAGRLLSPERKLARYRASSKAAGLGVVGLAGLLALMSFATRDLNSRIARPGVTGHPRAVTPFLGIDSWPYIFEIEALIGFAVVGGILVMRSCEQRRATPALLFFLAANALAWLDPLGNWGPYATYDPRLLHWPDSWPWASLAPNIEPCFAFIGYFSFYMGTPVLAVFLLRRLILPRLRQSAFPSRHPLFALTVLTFVVGFVTDTIVELSMLKIGVFTYTQVPSFGSVNKGHLDQFPLLIQATGTTIPFIVGALLWWRNDTGLTGAERLAQRWRILRKAGSAGVFAVFLALLSLGYLAYETPYIVVRATNSATVVARPWPWCETKVYDPNGRYKAAGESGPFYTGVWALSGDNGGRSAVRNPGQPLPGACKA